MRELSADNFTHRLNILCSCSSVCECVYSLLLLCVCVFLCAGLPYVTHRSMQTIFHHTNAFEICLTKIEHSHGIFNNIHFNRSHAMTPNGPTAFAIMCTKWKTCRKWLVQMWECSVKLHETFVNVNSALKRIWYCRKAYLNTMVNQYNRWSDDPMIWFVCSHKIQ